MCRKKGTVPSAVQFCSTIAISVAILIGTRSAGIHWAGEAAAGLGAVSLVRAAV